MDRQLTAVGPFSEKGTFMDLLQILTNVSELWSKYWQLFLFEGVKNTLILTSIAVVLGICRI